MIRVSDKAASIARSHRIPGWELDYFNSKEWLDVQDTLDQFEEIGTPYTPLRSNLFRSLLLCPMQTCNVLFMGQDPYKTLENATGVGFSIPKDKEKWPPTLLALNQELARDLNISLTHGNLEHWCRQGVLLWNAVPLYSPYKDGMENTVNYFTEWGKLRPLTQEIVERLSAKGKIIFVLIGRKAHEFAVYIDPYNNRVVYCSHPSPRGQLKAKSKFAGSRIFSTINAHLNFYLKEPINWV